MSSNMMTRRPLHWFANDVERTRRSVITLLINDRDLVAPNRSLYVSGGHISMRLDPAPRSRHLQIFATFLLEMSDVIDIARQVRDPEAEQIPSPAQRACGR